MDKTSLEKNLANMERELVALQTAHEIGLGSVIYWEYGGTTTPVQMDYRRILIMVGVKSGEKLNPILTCYTDTGYFPQIYKSDVYDDRYLFSVVGFSDFTTFTWKLVSTSQVYYNYAETLQEASDWMGW